MLIAKAVNRSLDIYLKAVRNTEEEMPVAALKQQDLLKIGELAQAVQESVATIRHWTKERLLEVAEVTPTGYQLYSPAMIEQVKDIKKLKRQRYTIKEIRDNFKERGVVA